jgi:hypothetical protein
MSKLRWQKAPGYYGLTAVTEIGSYNVFNIATQDAFQHRGSSYAAFFRPRQGRSLSPKDRQPLGNVNTLAKAKGRCEQHYASQPAE